MIYGTKLDGNKKTSIELTPKEKIKLESGKELTHLLSCSKGIFRLKVSIELVKKEYSHHGTHT